MLSTIKKQSCLLPLALLCFVFFPGRNVLFSQDFLGYSNSNNVGVTGISLQPACIVDDRLAFDMTILGGNVALYNNYLGLKRDALNKVNGAYPAFSDPDFIGKYLSVRSNTLDKSILFSNRTNMPSFMVYANHKTAFAFTWDVRTYLNIDGVSPELAKVIYRELDYPTVFLQNFSNKNLSVQTMLWSEYGFTFGHVLKENNQHYFKAAGRIKLLQGIMSAYLFAKNLQFQFTNTDTVSFFHSQISYGHSRNFELSEDNKIRLKDFESFPGVGGDLGLVYEWRPEFEKYKYDMDGEKGLWRRDLDKYKIRLGFSVLDLGMIKFKKHERSNDFIADIGLWNIKSFQPKSIKDFDDTIRKHFPSLNSSSTYTMALPTSMSLQFDYRIWKDFYLNITPFYAFQYKNRESKVHDYSTLSFTPRWDHRWFGVFIPFRYNTLDNFRYGITLRMGPVIFGTSNIGPLISRQDTYGSDFHIIFKIPIELPHPHDKDKDGVSDKKDKCPDVVGTWEQLGCADADADGVQDKDDKCPAVPGVVELAGCPDSDGDKVADGEDRCPKIPGPVEFKGCPDSDKDGLMDDDDECPADSGLIEFMGCPDMEKDGVPDKFDRCPKHAGSLSKKGCPDKDNDQLPDIDDACPGEAGPKENKGCPYTDSDKDGLLDKDDECPETPGKPENKGCPEIKQEEKKIIEEAFSSLEFASGKEIIKPSSYPSLNALAKLMKEHSKDWKLKLSGHTDNQGSPESNLVLSEHRVNAVKNYLVKKGVKTESVMTEWFGQTKPISANDTEKGRQKNRRVEMKILHP